MSIKTSNWLAGLLLAIGLPAGLLSLLSTGVLAWHQPDFAGQVPRVAPAQPNTLTVASAAVITITTGGFVPGEITTTAGVQVVWYNATAQTQVLESGTVNRLFLPLIMRGATGFAKPNNPAAPASPRVPLSSSGLFSATLAPGGRFTYTFQTPGAYPYFLLTAMQFSGLAVVQQALPPDPSAVAPPLDPSVATSLCAAAGFLDSGSTPIQTGVISGTITCQRAAVLRGRLISRAGQPLSGVTVSILGHPEFGQTLSRADGLYDLSVNGGGYLTLNFSAAGYLTAQRQINVPWQEYVRVPDVALIPADSQVTLVNLPNGNVQVARGSVMTDSDGTRQETLLFPAGVTATLVFSNGTQTPVSQLHVRATEFTIGPNGPAAMPGELPANSGYTYATEFSADEAAAAGATGVSFGQPIVSYNENFLNFPIGSLVPIGYYDRAQGMWIPSDNGLVVKILSTGGGLANLDVDGSGNPATAPQYAALSMTDAERQQLAALYAVGQSLWRVPITHFTPFDKNRQFSVPPGAVGPAQPPPKGHSDPCTDQQPGSVIECQTQILGEDLPLTGLDFGLHYRSSRTPGFQAADTLMIPVSGITVPASLRRIELNLAVAGQSITVTLPASPTQSYPFAWNGLDGYGRVVQGMQPVVVRIGYVYGTVYATPAQYQQSFGNFGGVATADPARQEYTFWQEYRTVVGSWDARGSGLGGWTLGIHHFYDPGGRVLYYGDGSSRSAQGMVNSVIGTSAGSGVSGFSGDSGPAVNAQLNSPAGVVVADDGTVYIADASNNRIRRIDPQGIIHTFAGGGILGDGAPATSAALFNPVAVALGPDQTVYLAEGCGNCKVWHVDAAGIIHIVAGGGSPVDNLGDGLPATQAQLNQPVSIAVSPDGSLYIADKGHMRVRRVSPTGVITTVVGNGTFGDTGDGGPAYLALLTGPLSVAPGPDGSLYVLDPDASGGGYRVRRIGVDGIIRTVAGGASGCSSITNPTYCGDGGPATQARLETPVSIVVAKDGTLYIAQEYSSNGRIRRVRPDGIINTIAGGNIICSIGLGCGDGGPAAQAGLNYPTGIALAPDGSYYISELQHRLRQVGGQMPGFTSGVIQIPSEDGSLVYRFAGNGRHLATLNALTGATLYTFAYDLAGRLITITDANGLLTTIQRDGQGNPTGILAPGGQLTTLTLNGSGYLATIANPAGNTVQLSYSGAGLLTELTDPNGNAHTYTYDGSGRLVKDQDPLGGFSALARVESATNLSVTLTSALSRTTTYGLALLPTGNISRTKIDPGGHQTVALNAIDATRVITLPSGASVLATEGADPRFRMQAPFAKSLIVSMPSGKQQTTLRTIQAALTDTLNLLSLSMLTDTLSLNGRTYTDIYQAAIRTFSSTTPAGRTGTTVIDAQGRVIQQSVPGLNAVTYTYDSRGRLSQVAQGGRILTLAYDAHDRLASVTDPLGQTASYGYDAADRLISETLPGGRSVAFTYDANGNRLSLTPPGKPAHSFTYDARDMLTNYLAPGVGAGGTDSTRSAYNLDGQTTVITRPDGIILTATYDSAGRPSAVTQPRGATTYAYDTLGRLATITAPVGSALNLTYDGALLTNLSWSGPVVGTVNAAYDNDFRATSDNINGSSGAAYTYDTDSLVTQAGALTAGYDPQNGLLTGTAIGSLTTTQTYNGFGEVTGYTAFYAGSSRYAEADTRDNLGRLITQTQTVSGTAHTFGYSYDAAGRLTQVRQDGPAVLTYTYDLNDNRLSANGASATYDNQDRLLTFGTNVYTYTAEGDLASKITAGGTTTYTYDALGNLMSVGITGTTHIDYVVDGLNRRIGKKVNGVLVKGWLYQDALRPIAELDGSNSVVSRFVYLGSGAPSYLVNGGQTYRLLTDQVGSVRLVVNTATGAIAQELDYDAFGSVLTDTNPGFQPFGFAGGLYDPATGLVRFGARDYDPQAGRWTAKDPIRFAEGDANLYAYVVNDPINGVDANGLGELIGPNLYYASQKLQADTPVNVNPNPNQNSQADASMNLNRFPNLNQQTTGPASPGVVSGASGVNSISSGGTIFNCNPMHGCPPQLLNPNYKAPPPLRPDTPRWPNLPDEPAPHPYMTSGGHMVWPNGGENRPRRRTWEPGPLSSAQLEQAIVASQNPECNDP